MKGNEVNTAKVIYRNVLKKSSTLEKRNGIDRKKTLKE